MRLHRCTACGAFNRLPDAPKPSPRCGRCKAALDESGAPQPVDTDGLQRALEASPIPVLVDFWAPWCGPCRAAAPVLDRLARERAGRLLVLKLDTQEHPAAGARHRVQSIPTFALFNGGTEASRQVGLPPPAELARWIDGAAAARTA